jgi:hypothetical protein
MTKAPRHPETHLPLQTVADFDALARGIADSQEVIVTDPAVVEAPALTPGQELEARAAKMAEKAHLAAKAGAEIEPVTEEREDPQESLGGGIKTYNEQGILPVPDVLGFSQQVTRTRGGKLVTRVTLGSKFRDVPVDDHSDFSDFKNIEFAKEQLRQGRGTPVARLRQRRRAS